MTDPTGAPCDQLGSWAREQAPRAGAEAGLLRWVPVGTRSSGTLARVDPAGLVSPAGGGWSLDWWVGAEDRWHLPARERAVQQALVDGSPVVETRLRVPGGAVVHRVGAAQGSQALDGREAVVVEIVNETPTPVAVALAVRPYDLTGTGGVGAIRGTGDRALVVDDRWTVLADRAPRLGATATGQGDPVGPVTGGGARPGPVSVVDGDGRASAAVVFPLPHTARLTAVLVAGEPLRTPDGELTDLPTMDALAAGWARQVDHGLRVSLPDQALESAITAARRRLVLVAPELADRTSAADVALVARALSVYGHHEDLRPTVAAALDGQRLTGELPDEECTQAATGATLALLGWWWRHAPRPELADELAGPVAHAVRHIDRRRTGRGRRARRAALVPAGPQPPELGPPTVAYLDDWWSAAGLLEAAHVLHAGGQDEAADRAASVATELLNAVTRSAQGRPLSVGPGGGPPAAGVGILPALAPLGVLDPTAPEVIATLDTLLAQMTDEEGAVHAGVRGPARSVWLTACLTLHELEHGRRSGFDRLEWLVRAGGTTASWPVVPGPTGTPGVEGEVAAALFLQAARALLVTERRRPGAVEPDGLDLLPAVPRAWYGQGVEVHGAPTTFGSFGYAVRWHGARPALLWELDRRPGAPTPTIRVPGLAPGFSTDEPVGEALLPPPPGAPERVATGDETAPRD